MTKTKTDSVTVQVLIVQIREIGEKCDRNKYLAMMGKTGQIYVQQVKFLIV